MNLAADDDPWKEEFNAAAHVLDDGTSTLGLVARRDNTALHKPTVAMRLDLAQGDAVVIEMTLETWEKISADLDDWKEGRRHA